MTNSHQGFIALTRFGYGPRGDGDLQAAVSDPRGFLKAELLAPSASLLSGPTLQNSVVAAQIFYDDAARKKAEREKAEREKLAQKFAAVEAPAATAQNIMVSGGPAQPENMKPVEPPPKPQLPPEQVIFRAEALARIRRACLARAGIIERLVAFWSNHFCVSVAKSQFVRITAGAFEREAIRPHVLGAFREMLLAVESHPAMLQYLDNAQSVGPESKAGQNSHRGLNENLAREIMELHTLGVGSGYTQADVTSLAKILTGWSVIGAEGKNGEPGAFFFNANAHEPGNQTLLGRDFSDEGLGQGETALTYLVEQPACSHFIARKFAQSFVADQPSDALINHLAQVFRQSRGDLKALTLALLDSEEAWATPLNKIKTPYEFLIATNRMLDHAPEDPGPFLNALNTLGMPLWTPPGPNGYADEFANWAAPEAMKLRLDLAAQTVSQLKDPPNPSLMLEALCGDWASPATKQAVARAETKQQGIALLLMSPELQRR